MWTKRSRKCYEQTPRISAIFFIISCNILKSARKTLSKLQKHLHIKSSHPRITAPNSEFEPKFFWEDGNSVFIDSYYRQGETQAGSLTQRLKIQHFRKKVFNFDHYPSLFEPPDFHYWLLCRLTSSILSKMEENSPIHWHGSLCSTDVLSRSQRLLQAFGEITISLTPIFKFLPIAQLLTGSFTESCSWVYKFSTLGKHGDNS